MRQRAIIVGSVAVLALLGAGCGSTAHSSGSQGMTRALPASASEAAAALKASRCMRAHGVPNWPDPILGGHFGFLAFSGVNRYTPQYKAAFAYCTTRYHIFKHISTPAQIAQSNAEAVKFSACMRSHGAADCPDPDGEGAIDLPSDTYESSPKVQRAEAACKSLREGKTFALAMPVPVR